MDRRPPQLVLHLPVSLLHRPWPHRARANRFLEYRVARLSMQFTDMPCKARMPLRGCRRFRTPTWPPCVRVYKLVPSRNFPPVFVVVWRQPVRSLERVCKQERPHPLRGLHPQLSNLHDRTPLPRLGPLPRLRFSS